MRSLPFEERRKAHFRQGLVLTAIDNTSATPIVGTFSNLSDGAVLTANGNNFQASYEGGDGNDLTLNCGTVVLGPKGKHKGGTNGKVRNAFAQYDCTFVPPPLACCCYAQSNQAAFVSVGIGWLELSFWRPSESNVGSDHNDVIPLPRCQRHPPS